jgi:zinc transport system substrate-binding protein
MAACMPLRLFALLLLLLSAPLAAHPLQVFVAVPPLAWLVEQVGGPQVQVHSLVVPGQDPHSFEPTPSQLSALQGADLYLRLDMPFERAWLPRVMTVNPDLLVIALYDELQIEPALQTGGQGDADDPHVWTDPRLMLALSEMVRDTLIGAQPSDTAGFHRRQQALALQLEALDRQLASRFARLARKTFLVHHPAWGFFARRYGLTQLAIEREGKEPGPRALAELATQVRRLGITTLFVEPQASDHLAHGLADTLGLRIVPLDPLAADYPANLRHVADLIEEAGR